MCSAYIYISLLKAYNISMAVWHNYLAMSGYGGMMYHMSNVVKKVLYLKSTSCYIMSWDVCRHMLRMLKNTIRIWSPVLFHIVDKPYKVWRVNKVWRNNKVSIHEGSKQKHHPCMIISVLQATNAWTLYHTELSVTETLGWCFWYNLLSGMSDGWALTLSSWDALSLFRIV